MGTIKITVNDDLQLRSWKPEWASELFRLVDKNRKLLQPWLPWVPGVKRVEDSKKFIATSLKEQRKGVGLELGIWYQDKLVGCLGLHGLDKNNRRASLGCWLDFDYQGKGIITLSIKALVDYCFQKLKLNRIGFEAATKNTKSLALAERLGFAKEGVVREFEFVNNRFLDYSVFSVLEDEWKN